MASTIHCDIVSAEAELYSGEAEMVIVSGEEGELGIAPRHAPLLTRIKPGQVRVKKSDGTEDSFFVSGGMLEVQPHVVTILADTAARAADLDEAAAVRAREEARRALGDQASKMEFAEAQAKLAEALAQLAAIERLRKNLKR